MPHHISQRFQNSCLFPLSEMFHYKLKVSWKISLQMEDGREAVGTQLQLRCASRGRRSNLTSLSGIHTETTVTTLSISRLFFEGQLQWCWACMNVLLGVGQMCSDFSMGLEFVHSQVCWLWLALSTGWEHSYAMVPFSSKLFKYGGLTPCLSFSCHPQRYGNIPCHFTICGVMALVRVW